MEEEWCELWSERQRSTMILLRRERFGNGDGGGEYVVWVCRMDGKSMNLLRRGRYVLLEVEVASMVAGTVSPPVL